MGENENTNIVRGRVTGLVLGLCTNISYEDGCQRPGDKNLVKDSIVVSEVSVVNGICEHIVLQVIEPKVVEKPQPVRKVVQPVKAAPLTVDQIVKAAEQRKQRLALPKEDAPVSQDIIEAAKRPPKIRVDLSTSPAAKAALATTPIEDRFEYDLSPEERRELNQIHSSNEPIGGGELVNPFNSNFDPRGSVPAPKRKGPVSVFDLK